MAFGFWRVEENFYQDCQSSNKITQEAIPVVMDDVFTTLLVKYTEASVETEMSFRHDLGEALREKLPERECERFSLL